MGNYIDELNSKAEMLSLEDDEYEGNLLEIAKLFKDFGNALTLFLTQYGFCNEQLDNRGRINYIRTQFSKHDMKIPRGLGSWFESGKKIERKTAYQFCFALELSGSDGAVGKASRTDIAGGSGGACRGRGPRGECGGACDGGFLSCAARHSRHAPHKTVQGLQIERQLLSQSARNRRQPSLIAHTPPPRRRRQA